jgi:hypothetical protein
MEKFIKLSGRKESLLSSGTDLQQYAQRRVLSATFNFLRNKDNLLQPISAMKMISGQPWRKKKPFLRIDFL